MSHQCMAQPCRMESGHCKVCKLDMVETNQSAALARLVKIAKGSTGQSARVANFLLAWWNAKRDGGFDFTDLWNVDQQIQDDMITVFALVARSWAYPDKFGYQADFEALVTQWRKPKRRSERS